MIDFDPTRLPRARHVELRRIGRWACLVGAVVFAVLALISHHVSLQYDFIRGNSFAELAVLRGRVGGTLTLDWPDPLDANGSVWNVHLLEYKPRVAWHWHWPWPPVVAGAGRCWTLIFPDWLPVPIFGLAGAWLWYADARARHCTGGHCPACGYDIRGLTPAAVCPECGGLAVRPSARGVEP